MTLADTPPADLAQAFIEKWADVVGPFPQLVSGVDILGVTAAGDQAMIMYEMQTAPFGTLAAAELLRFKDGRIVNSRLVFDTHPVHLAKASE